ncbi:AraC family transcriptional regulator [Bradyrhizobium prioriisuperbiae]|uniref:AraC family transcriptional regulator n=1 Tax=Bradyrhizobium prioriisuperbiae TaxID=2854389 RepID=UPI0028E90CA4|nr:AraC family transcriptional regulator [Bradyrhizobium prioritasuperba]
MNDPFPLSPDIRISEQLRIDATTAKTARFRTRTWAGVELGLADAYVCRQAAWAWESEQHHMRVIFSTSSVRFNIKQLGNVEKISVAPGRTYFTPARCCCVTETRGTGHLAGAGLNVHPSAIADVIGIPRSDIDLRPKHQYSDPFVWQAALQLRALLDDTDDLSEMLGQTLAQAICLHLYREYSRPGASLKSSRGPGLSIHLASKLTDYINESLSERISLSEMASLLGMTPSSLIQSFRSTFGVTPAQYIIDKRLERATELLTTTDMGISHVAAEVGFCDNSHLTRYFKRRHNMAPSELRKHRRA